MKRIILSVLAILLSTGIAYATGIPMGTDPYDQPVIWTEQVYNGSGSDIATAHVVRWQFDTCDVTPNTLDDMCPWVVTADAADSPWVAGVTLTSAGISNGNVGTIIIKGPAVVDDGATRSVLTAGQLTGNSSTGHAADVSGYGADQGLLGVAIKASASNQGYADDSLVYIDPTLSADN